MHIFHIGNTKEAAFEGASHSELRLLGRWKSSVLLKCVCPMSVWPSYNKSLFMSGHFPWFCWDDIVLCDTVKRQRLKYYGALWKYDSWIALLNSWNTKLSSNLGLIIFFLDRDCRYYLSSVIWLSLMNAWYPWLLLRVWLRLLFWFCKSDDHLYRFLLILMPLWHT